MSTSVDLKHKYAELEKLQLEISTLSGIGALLGWDQSVNMPSGSSEARARHMTAITGITHEKQTSAKLGEVINQLTTQQTNSSLSEKQIANVREAKRAYDRQSKVPRELAERIAKMSAEGYDTWVKAREKNDFAVFMPSLKKWVDLMREKAHCIDPTKPAYEVLLDEWERGMTCSQIDTIFAEVKASLVPLIEAIKNKPKPNQDAVTGKFDVAEQAKLSHQIAKDLGFDTNVGRLDVSIHPFTTNFALSDVRITTRYRDDDFVQGLTGTIHETGHALYEQGLDAEFAEQPVSKALSMGLHESQSLLWERMVGLSVPFWTHYWPKVQQAFPNIPRNTTVADFYKTLNTVTPSLVRVEADEVTYPLHIILRYEIESGLLSGKIPVDEKLPQLWNDKMKEYLGVVPSNDKDGILQDIHWSDGLFAYFPTYTLGAIYASQFYSTAKSQMPNLEAEISEGKFSSLRNWLKEKIHKQGSFPASGDDLCKSVTGTGLSAQFFLKYLTTKYTDLYGL